MGGVGLVSGRGWAGEEQVHAGVSGRGEVGEWEGLVERNKW